MKAVVKVVLLIISLFVFSGIFFFSVCFFIWRVESQRNELSNKPATMVDFYKHDVESFRSKQYNCYGTCSCVENDELNYRRSPISLQNVKKVSTLFLAVSTFFAYRLATKHFKEECVNMLSSSGCDEDSVESIVEDCFVHTEEKEEKEEEVCPLTDALFGRRSVRDYTDEKIPKEEVKSIIDVGNFAPSGGNRQPLKYYVCDNKALLQEISDVCMATGPHMNLKNIFYNAAVVIFVTWKGGIPGDENLDAGVAMQNMQLYSHNKGIGSCCIGLTKHCAGFIAEVMGFEEEEVYTCAMTLGYANPERKIRTPKRKESKINWKQSEYDDDDL